MMSKNFQVLLGWKRTFVSVEAVGGTRRPSERCAVQSRLDLRSAA